MFQETQQNTFKFVKSPEGEINFRPPLGIPVPSLDRQHKYFLRIRYQTNFQCHHQKLDCSSTPKPLRSRTIESTPLFRIEIILSHTLYIRTYICTVHRVLHCSLSKHLTFASLSSSAAFLLRRPWLQ